MLNKNPHLSIIIPAYNSESFLGESMASLDRFTRELKCSAEIIIVDDGSRDKTKEVAQNWANQPRSYAARVISYSDNKGKGGAVAEGMLAASGKFRIFLDADLAYQPPQILRLLHVLEEGADVAVASRVHPDSRYTISPNFFHYLYTRHVASRLINWTLRRLIIQHCRDSQAGLKGFSDEAAKAIFSRQMIRGFTFDVEVLYLAEKMGLTIREVPVDYQYFNEPTTVQFLSDGCGMLKDIFRIYRNNISGKYRLPYRCNARKLAINADDFGMTEEISRGILKTIQSGAVRSTSAMTNSPSFHDSMDMLMLEQNRPAVGLHLTMTWGKPLSDPSKVPTLVDENGNFHSRSTLLMMSMRGKISKQEALLEIRMQLEKLKNRYPQITHIDGHHHVHVFPSIRDAVAIAAREFGIKIVRAPREGMWSHWSRAVIRRLPIALLKASTPAYWRSQGFICADHFGGYFLGSSENLSARWEDIFNRIPAGVTEIMVHPGYLSNNRDGYNAGREDELAILSDPSFVTKAEDAGVKIISISEI